MGKKVKIKFIYKITLRITKIRVILLIFIKRKSISQERILNEDCIICLRKYGKSFILKFDWIKFILLESGKLSLMK